MLDDGQYELSRVGKRDHEIYRQEDLQQSEMNVRSHDIVQPRPMARSDRNAQGKVKMEGQRLSSEEKLVEGDDQDSDEELEDSDKELAKFGRPSSRELFMNGFLRGIPSIESFVNRTRHERMISGDIDDAKLRSETTTIDVVQEQKQRLATATEQSTKVDDAHLVLPRVSEGKVLEEVSAESDRRLCQKSLKKAEIWSLKAVPSMFGLGERPLEKGKTRVRWRCACGRSMYDDFTELRAGAAAELEKWLNDSMRNHAVSGPSNPSSTATLRSSVSPNAANSGHQQTAESDISLQRRIDTLGGFSGNAATTLDVHLEKCWLLVCGNSKGGPDSLLTQLDLSHTPSDKNLFIEMRGFYSNLRNSWGLRPFLRGVKTIRFVQVYPSI